ncbi:MAG: hypothetical protein NTZ51_06215 [Proteobacteria bacterium]|nr:hypothetical protein [Pseudomonadota bacterium]
MEIKYSAHIINRLLLRKIEYDLPKRIVVQSNERYSDVETGHTIAIMPVELYNKNREVMVAYIIEGNSANLLTIHPLKQGQKENRIKSGRWRRI